MGLREHLPQQDQETLALVRAERELEAEQQHKERLRLLGDIATRKVVVSAAEIQFAQREGLIHQPESELAIVPSPDEASRIE